MMDLIDKTAEALRTEFDAYRAEKDGRGLSTAWADLPDARREKWRRMARAALGATVLPVAREAAPFHGLAENGAHAVDERLQLALKALGMWEELTEEVDK